MGGQGGGPRRAADRHLDNSEFTGLPLDNSELRSGLPYTWQLPLRPSGALAALPHRAQSPVRVNATLHHPLVRCRLLFRLGVQHIRGATHPRRGPPPNLEADSRKRVGL